MILGHQKQWDFLKKAAAKGKIPHGILFCGPEHLGKKTLAVEFIKFLNCASPEFFEKPCGVCKNCRDIGRGGYPDLIVVEKKEEKEEIEIAQIRELSRLLSLKPHSSNFKAAIVDDAHLMNQEAQSCFLKLLEEPRGNAILILATMHPSVLLPTILSRVQKLNFLPLKNEEIEKALVSRGVETDKAKIFAAFSSGRPGVAENFFVDPSKIDGQRNIIADLLKLSKADLASRFQYAKKMCGDKDDKPVVSIKEILEIWLKYLRKTFILRLSNRPEEVRERAFGDYALGKIIKIIRQVQSTDFLLSTTNANSKLALEILLMEL